MLAHMITFDIKYRCHLTSCQRGYVENLKNIEIEAVIKRLMDAFGVNSERKLSEKLGASPTMAAIWRKRSQIPYQACVIAHFRTGKSLSWLMEGKDIDHSGAFNRDKFIAEFKETVMNGIQMELLSESENTNDATLNILGTHLFNALTSKQDETNHKAKKIS